MNNDVISTWDHVHLHRDQEPVFVASIGDALYELADHFVLLLLNIDREAVLTCTKDLCFEQK